MFQPHTIASIITGLIVATIAGGCATPSSLIAPPPAPAVVVDPPPPPPPAPVLPPVPPTPLPPAVAQSSLYGLWYATNRTPVLSTGLVVGYSEKIDDDRVHYGKIYAEIPKDYLKEHNSPGFLNRLFRTSEAKLRLTKPNEVQSRVFIEQMKKQLQNTPSDERQVLIYLHGFNTTFKEAAQRAASIGYQLKMPTTAFFSWPSQGSMPKYEADKDLADLSQDSIADFIIKIHAESGAKNIHLIAHSMGNYALLGAIYRPKLQLAIKNGLRFGQIILAAPGVDTARFIRDAGILSSIADRVSLYVSDGDKALNTSKRIAAKRPRAGLRPPIVIVKNIDTLDASSTNLTFLGHSYVEAETAVMNDMHSLIWHNDPPSKRAGVLLKSNYWELKKGYKNDMQVSHK